MPYIMNSGKKLRLSNLSIPDRFIWIYCNCSVTRLKNPADDFCGVPDFQILYFYLPGYFCSVRTNSSKKLCYNSPIFLWCLINGSGMLCPLNIMKLFIGRCCLIQPFAWEGRIKSSAVPWINNNGVTIFFCNAFHGFIFIKSKWYLQWHAQFTGYIIILGRWNHLPDRYAIRSFRSAKPQSETQKENPS